MNDYDEFMSKPEPEVRSEDELIEAIFNAADYFGSTNDRERDRKLSDAIDEALSHAYAEGRADERKEHEFEKAARRMNETGQGEHGGLHPVFVDILNAINPRKAA